MTEKTKRPNKRVCTELDVKLGARIKEGRVSEKKSLEQLASAIGVTFQQIQKYERGLNRVSVSRLIAISSALAIPPKWFLENL